MAKGEEVSFVAVWIIGEKRLVRTILGCEAVENFLWVMETGQLTLGKA